MFDGPCMRPIGRTIDPQPVTVEIFSDFFGFPRSLGLSSNLISADHAPLPSELSLQANVSIHRNPALCLRGVCRYRSSVSRVLHALSMSLRSREQVRTVNLMAAAPAAPLDALPGPALDAILKSVGSTANVRGRCRLFREEVNRRVTTITVTFPDTFVGISE